MAPESTRGTKPESYTFSAPSSQELHSAALSELVAIYVVSMVPLFSITVDSITL